MINTFCPYCGRHTGSSIPTATPMHNWCGECVPDPKTCHWHLYSHLCSKTSMPVGSYFYSLLRNTLQLEGTKMTTEASALINRLSGMDYPLPDDLLKLHSLLQEPENSKQLVSTPEDIDKLYEILTTIAVEAEAERTVRKPKASQSAAVEAWIGKDDEEDDDL